MSQPAPPELLACDPPPAHPQGATLLHTTQVSSFEVSLAWTPSVDSNVTQYRVFDGSTLLGVVNSAAFSHRPVVVGETYAYTVTALTAAGGESDACNTVRVVVPNDPPGPLQTLLPGHWYEVPNSHLHDAALSPAIYPWLGQGERIDGLMNDWSSGALDTQRDRLYVTGGGHNGYYGNEIYAFDLHTLAWVTMTLPDPVVGECPAPSLGVNCATHTYDGLEYLPPPFDAFLVIGWDGWPETTLNLNTHRWTSHPQRPQGGARTGANSAYDPIHKVVWYHSGSQAMSYWDPANAHWTVRSQWDSTAYYQTAVVDPVRQLYVGTGQGNTSTWTLDALGAFVPHYARLPTTGDIEIEAVPNPGLDYDASHDRMVAWRGGGDVYFLNLDTLVWIRQPALGTVVPGPANATGTYGRFRYVPDLNALVVVSSAVENVFVYRLEGAAPLLRRLDVTSAAAALAANLETQLTVQARYQDGTVANVTGAATFASLDPAVASVDAAGHIFARAAGQARIQTSYTNPNTRQGLWGSVLLTVQPLNTAGPSVVLNGLQILPGPAMAMALGETRPIWAQGTGTAMGIPFSQRSNCNTLAPWAGLPVHWTSDNPSVAAFSGHVLVAGQVGSTTIHAEIAGSPQGLLTAQATVLVTALPTDSLKAFNLQPSGTTPVAGWIPANESAFDAARGWGWQGITNPFVRGDRDGSKDPRLASFIGTDAGEFRVQVPDGRYHVAAGLGDNAYGAGLSLLSTQGTAWLAHVGTGNTSGTGRVEVTGGQGLRVSVRGVLDWLAVMPEDGRDFESVLAAAKTW